MQGNEEWIAAATALEMLEPTMGEYQATRAICKRAHAGMIAARADQFTIDGEPRRETNLPKGFWWAEGEAALDQDWIAGDFETWLDHKFHLRAFGVSFRRSDVEKLLPGGAAPKPAAPAPAIISNGGRMNAMAWAQFALDYLKRARSTKHDELNSSMNELKETDRSLRDEDWYRVSKGNLPILYQFSLEFTGDTRIPGELYASPQDVAVRLAEYRALLQQMRSELVAVDTAYREKESVQERQWMIGMVLDHVEHFLRAIDHVEEQRPAALSTGLVGDLMIATRLATRFHESVLALRKHPRSRPLLPVNDEWDCQYLFHSILRSYFSDIRPEEFIPSVAGSASRCEFFLKEQRLMIEMKYVRASGDQSKIKGELLRDFADYGTYAGVDYVIVLVYDPTHQLPQAVQLKDLIVPYHGLEQVNIVVTPSRS